MSSSIACSWGSRSLSHQRRRQQHQRRRGLDQKTDDALVVPTTTTTTKMKNVLLRRQQRTSSSYWRSSRGAPVVVASSASSSSPSSLSPDSPIALQRAHVIGAYDEWCIDRGIDAPALYIGYVDGGTPDAGETYRGCIASAPVAAGKGGRRGGRLTTVKKEKKKGLYIVSVSPHTMSSVVSFVSKKENITLLLCRTVVECIKNGLSNCITTAPPPHFPYQKVTCLCVVRRRSRSPSRRTRPIHFRTTSCRTSCGPAPHQGSPQGAWRKSSEWLSCCFESEPQPGEETGR